MKPIANSMSPPALERLRLGKYTRWVDYVSEDAFLRLLAAVVAFDAAVFPAGEPRRVFPVWRHGTSYGSPFRVQLPLEALCMIVEWLAQSTAALEFGTLVNDLERLGTPMRILDEASPESPCSEALRSTIRSRPPIAVFADVNEQLLALIMWQLGEIQARTRWDDRASVTPAVEVIGEKPYREPFSALPDRSICERMSDDSGLPNAETTGRWSEAHSAFLVLIRALHPSS